MADRSPTGRSEAAARPAPDDALATTWLERVGAELADTIQRDPGATLTGPPAPPTRLPRDPIAVLRQLAGQGPHAQLALERTLGQGGMGVVRLARQVSLARDVAVKTLRPGRTGDDTVRALLREAWITGSLEHPNVVPVHDLGLDGDGTPFIVFKRIEGVAWRELIRDARAVADRFGAEDLLEWNLGVLLGVINAVRYAHSRGVVHRDLKPDNVMIGEFGEVYVVDWGLAVSTRDDGSGRLPLARDAREMAGTPLYMAPEMLGDGSGELSERTDIYLLGAVLYEIVCGRPPHAGPSAGAILASIALSRLEYPDHAPDGLVRICRRALDPDPDGRFERAEQVRLALQGYLQHRGSERLAGRAERRLTELQGLLADPADDPAWRHRLYNVFGACRFGFQEAVNTWPGNLPAQIGLRAAITAMAEHELASGDPRAAANLIAELDEPPDELGARIDAALRDDEQRRARLDKLDADLDPGTGARTRSVVVSILGGLWTVIPLIMWFVDRRVSLVEYDVGAVSTAVVLVLLIALVGWARETLFKTAVNRRLFGVITLVPAAQAVFIGACWWLAVPPPTAFTLILFLWAVAATFTTVLILSYVWPVALAYFVAFAVAVWRPDLAFLVTAAANSVMLPVAWLNWRQFRHLYTDPG